MWVSLPSLLLTVHGLQFVPADLGVTEGAAFAEKVSRALVVTSGGASACLAVEEDHAWAPEDLLADACAIFAVLTTAARCL